MSLDGTLTLVKVSVFPTLEVQCHPSEKPCRLKRINSFGRVKGQRAKMLLKSEGRALALSIKTDSMTLGQA